MAARPKYWWEFLPGDTVVPGYGYLGQGVFSSEYWDGHSEKLEENGPFTIKAVWATMCNYYFIRFEEIPGTFRADNFYAIK